MVRRLAAALAAAACLATGARAAQLESIAGCTLKPVQNLRLVAAGPTSLRFAFTSPPGTSPACIDHFVASIYEAGSIRPLPDHQDVVVAPPTGAGAGSSSAVAATSVEAQFGFDDLEPAHEYRAIVTAIPAPGAAAEYARAVSHAAAVVVTVTPRDPAAGDAPPVRGKTTPGGGGSAVPPLDQQKKTDGGGSSSSSSSSSSTSGTPGRTRPVVYVLPPPSPRLPPPPPPPASPRGPGGRPHRGSSSNSNGGRAASPGAQGFRPAGAAPHEDAGADAAAASAGSEAPATTTTTVGVGAGRTDMKSGMQKDDSSVGKDSTLTRDDGNDGDQFGMVLGGGATAAAPTHPPFLEPWATDALDFAARQLLATVADIGLDSPSVPRSAQPGVGVRMEQVVSEKGVLGWTAGFFPGSLWMLYEYLSLYAGGGEGVEAAAGAPTRSRRQQQHRDAAPRSRRRGDRSSSAGRRRGGDSVGGRRGGGGGGGRAASAVAAAPAPAPAADGSRIFGDLSAARQVAGEMLEAARAFTDLMAPVQHVINDHDVGFVAYCSYGQGYRVLNEQLRKHKEEQQNKEQDEKEQDVRAYRAALLATSASLATRHDPDVGCTASWDWWGKRGHDYPVIVDNLMNMEMMWWAAREHEAEAARLGREEEAASGGGGGGSGSGGGNGEENQQSSASSAPPSPADSAAANISSNNNTAEHHRTLAAQMRLVAVDHVRTTLANHFRNDAAGTAWHLVNYDPVTGAVRRRQNYQGYDDDSAWARGQGWALYAFAFAFRETGDRLFLRRAVKLADWLYTHPNMPEDGVPYWDYTDPRIPDVPRDASAGAVYASALYELSLYLRGDEADERLLRFGGGGGGEASTADANDATATTAVTFPVSGPEAERTADALWLERSKSERQSAGEALRARLRGYADRTMRSLASAEGPYRETVVGGNHGFVLRHSVGSLNERLMLEIDAPLNYADYYFLEAMVRRVQTGQELMRRRESMGGEEEVEEEDGPEGAMA